MSLKGDIEDVPLVEVMQLIAMAGKTGAMAIRTPLGEGGIGFSRGRVVSAYCWNSPPVDPAAASLPGEQRAALARERIAKALAQLLRLGEGRFEFTFSSSSPPVIGERDVALESAEPGLSVQEMLLDAQSLAPDHP